jgi:hypothetical protein
MTGQPRRLDSIEGVPVLKRVAEKLRAGYVREETYSPPEPECPTCGDMGWVGEGLNPGQQGFGMAKSCPTCGPGRKRIAPTDFTFETFRPYHPKLVAAIQLARGFAAGDWPAWLTLLGGNGVGKDHLSFAALQTRQNRGERVKAVKAVAMLRSIFATMDPLATVTEQEQVDYYARYPVLLVSEVGKQGVTDASRARFSEVIDERYVNRLPTIITSNWTMEQIESVWPDVASRMRDGELGATVDLFGVTDYRQWK